MSRSVIHCKSCRQQIAARHHSGQITVADGVAVVLLADRRVSLQCSCGAKRVLSWDDRDERKERVA